jgi:hypothetical protein
MKARLLQLVVVSGLAAAPLLLSARSADAGNTTPSSAFCVFYADGSGYCNGSLKAFRSSSDPNAELVLQHYVDSTNYENRYLWVSYGGTSKYINFHSTTPKLTAAFDQAAASVTASLYIHWNASNELDTFQLWNASNDL